MTNEERIREAVRILSEGGRLVVAKNVGLPAEVLLAGSGLVGVDVVVCSWLPDDTVIALAPGPHLKDVLTKFEMTLPDPAPSPASPETSRAPLPGGKP
jgi:hypothetical protein